MYYRTMSDDAYKCTVCNAVVLGPTGMTVHSNTCNNRGAYHTIAMASVAVDASQILKKLITQPDNPVTEVYPLWTGAVETTVETVTDGFEAVCTCKWRGGLMTDQSHAERTAEAHRYYHQRKKT